MIITACIFWAFCLCLSNAEEVSLTEELLRRIENLEDELGSIRDQNMELVREISHLKEREREATETNENTVSQSRRSMTRQATGQVVAFYAQLSGSEQLLKAGEIIKFDNITSNIGNGYESKTGKFTVPEDGPYWFSVSLLGHESNPEFEYIVNDVMYSRMKCYASSNGFQPSSQAAVFDLKKGNTVYIRNVNRWARLYGLLYSSFSGFKITGAQSGSQVVG